jgi:hypothetical protein
MARGAESGDTASVMTARRALFSCIAAAAASLGSTSAYGQSDDSNGQTIVRRGLIDAMQSAFQSGDFARCIDMGQRAASIRESSSLRRVIGECQLSSREYTAALASGEECLAMARRDPASPARETIITACQRILSDSQQHIARVTVVVPTDAPEGLRVTLAGRELPRLAWGVPAIVNAERAVDVRAEAAGYTAFRVEFSVAPAATREIRVELTREPARPTVEPGPTGNTSTTHTNSTPVTVTPPTPREPPPVAPRVASGFRATPLFVSGVVTGAAGVIAAATGWAIALATAGDYARRCSVVSTSSALDACAREYDGAQSTATAGEVTGSIGLGLVAIGAGLTVVGALRSGASEQPRAEARWVVAPLLAREARGLTVGVQW